MNAKEKARELLFKFMPLCNQIEFGKEKDGLLLKNAKQCALIAVDEFGERLWDLYDNSNVSDSSEMVIKEQMQYWQEVKEEIEKL